MNPAIWIALVPLVLGCFFAACHAALKTFSRKRLADLMEASGRAHRLEALDRRLPALQLLTGVLRVACGVVVIIATIELVQDWLAPVRVWVFYSTTFVVAAGLITVFHVAIPISWARYRQERLLAWSLPILTALLTVFSPVVWVLHVFDPMIRRISGVDLHADDADISDDVLAAVEDHESADQIDDEQKDMLEAVFSLPGTSAGEIMTPRTEVHGIEVDAALDEVKRTVLEDGHSRVPVYEESLDHIVGILYAKDLLKFLGDGAEFRLRDVAREAFLVPESKPVSDLLREFKQRKVHLAIVLDEYGGTAGLVTIEDILEEIVGEIQDEYEEEDEPEPLVQIDEHTFEVEARMDIDDLEDELDIAFPEDGDYDTLGGFVFATLGHIPDVGESFEYEGRRFTVTDAERTRVNKVKIEKLQEAGAPHANGG